MVETIVSHARSQRRAKNYEDAKAAPATVAYGPTAKEEELRVCRELWQLFYEATTVEPTRQDYGFKDWLSSLAPVPYRIYESQKTQKEKVEIFVTWVGNYGGLSFLLDEGGRLKRLIEESEEDQNQRKEETPLFMHMAWETSSETEPFNIFGKYPNRPRKGKLYSVAETLIALTRR